MSHLCRAVTLVCLSVAVAGCRRDPSPTVFIDPALAVLIPADTKLLAGVRMQKLRADQAVDKQVVRAPRLLQFRKDMGLPADSDVWEYLLTTNGTTWLALMRGKFTEMGMEPRLDKPGATRITHGGLTVLGDERGAVAFLNPTTAIAGKIDDVLRTLDLRNQNTGLPNSIQKLTDRIPSKYDLWFASLGLAPEFIEARGVKSAYGGLNLSTRKYDLVVAAETGSQSFQDAPVPESIVNWVLGNTRSRVGGALRQ